MSTPKGPLKSDRAHSKWLKAKIRLEGHKEQILRKLGFPDLTKSENETLSEMLTTVNRVIAKVDEHLEEFEKSRQPPKRPKKMDFSPPTPTPPEPADSSFDIPSLETLGADMIRMRKFLGITPGELGELVGLNAKAIEEYEAAEYSAAKWELVCHIVDILNAELSFFKALQQSRFAGNDTAIALK